MVGRLCPGCGRIVRHRGRCQECRAQQPRVRQPALWLDPRNTSRWADLRLRLFPLADCCGICGEGFPDGVPGRSKWAKSLDHVVPISRGGDWYDEQNLRVVHYGCNSSLGAKLARR